MIVLKWRNAHYEINRIVKNIQCTLTAIKWLSTSYFPEGDHLIDQLKGVRLYSQIFFGSQTSVTMNERFSDGTTSSTFKVVGETLNISSSI